MKHSKFAINALAAGMVVAAPIVNKAEKLKDEARSAFRDYKGNLIEHDAVTRWMAANSVRCQFCDQAPENRMCKFHAAKLNHDLPQFSGYNELMIANNWREGIAWLREQLGDEDSAFIDILTMDTHPRGIRISVNDGISDAKDD